MLHIVFLTKVHFHLFLIQSQLTICYCFICLPNLIHRSIYQTSFTSHSPTEALQLIGNQTCLKQASQLLSITNEVILRRIVTNLIHCTPLPELGDTVMITVNEMSFVSSWYLE